MRASRRGLLSVLLAIVFALAGRSIEANADTPAGTRISNTATLTYQNAAGESFTAVSNTVVTTIAYVASLTVTPKELACDPATDSYPVGTPIVKIFTILNSSNIPDAYTIAAAQASAGNITGISFFTPDTTAPVTVGSTVSPAVQPGGTIGVRVALSTASVPAGGKIVLALTARTTAAGTANGLQSDTGTQCALAGLAPSISGPSGAGTLVDKRVNGTSFMQSAAGSSLTYTISFRNSGGVPVLNALLSDTLPLGIVPDLSALKLNGSPVAGTLNGQVLAIPVGTLQPNVEQVVSIGANVTAAAGSGASLVNVASISGDNVPPAGSVPAAVWLGTGNVVFDGYAGASQPVANATAALLDPKTARPLSLGGSPVSANPSNANPFVTGAGGTYGFGLGPDQLGTPNAPADYNLVVAAPGYVNRLIAVSVTPDASGTLYSATLKALDGQPLAVAGGFGLTAGPVTVPNVYGLFGNIPLFAKSVVQITKTVDREIATAGDRLVWLLAYQNSGLAPLGPTTIVDTLPAGIVYAPGSARVDGRPLEPSQTGRVLEWSFPALDTKPHTIVYASVMVPGIAVGSMLTNTASISAAIPNAPGFTANASAQAGVRVIAGLYSPCITLVGRVYLDTMKSGRFEQGDSGIPGVRIFIESGESVTTDGFGRYSFACVREGMHVARLDPATLPPNAHPYDDRRYDSERSIRRLIHGIFDGMTIQDVNFALEDRS